MSLDLLDLPLRADFFSLNMTTLGAGELLVENETLVEVEVSSFCLGSSIHTWSSGLGLNETLAMVEVSSFPFTSGSGIGSTQNALGVRVNSLFSSTTSN